MSKFFTKLISSITNRDEPEKKKLPEKSDQKRNLENSGHHLILEKKKQLSKALAHFNKVRQVKYYGFEDYSSENFAKNIIAICEFFAFGNKDSSGREKFSERFLETVPRNSEDKDLSFNFPKAVEEEEFFIGDIHGNLIHLLWNLTASGVATIDQDIPFIFYDTQTGKKITHFAEDLNDKKIWERYRIIPNLKFNPDFKGQMIVMGDVMDRGIQTDECLFTILDLCAQEEAFLKEQFDKEHKQKQSAPTFAEYLENIRRLHFIIGDHEYNGILKITPVIPDYHEIESLLERNGNKVVADAIGNAIKKGTIKAGHIGKNGVLYTHALISYGALKCLHEELDDDAYIKFTDPKKRASIEISTAGRSNEELFLVWMAADYFINLKAFDSRMLDPQFFHDPQGEYQRNMKILIDHFNLMLKYAKAHSDVLQQTTTLNDSQNPLFKCYFDRKKPDDYQGPGFSRRNPIMNLAMTAHSNQPSHSVKHLSKAATVEGCEYYKAKAYIGDQQVSEWYDLMLGKTDYHAHPSFSKIGKNGEIPSLQFKYEDRIFKKGKIYGGLDLDKEEKKSPPTRAIIDPTPKLADEFFALITAKNDGPDNHARREREMREILKINGPKNLGLIIEESRRPARVATFDNDGNNILHLACKYCYPNLLKDLLKNPVMRDNINTRNISLQVPLTIAVINNDLVLVKSLLDENADPDCVGGAGIKVVFPPIEQTKNYPQYKKITELIATYYRAYHTRPDSDIEDKKDQADIVKTTAGQEIVRTLKTRYKQREDGEMMTDIQFLHTHFHIKELIEQLDLEEIEKNGQKIFLWATKCHDIYVASKILEKKPDLNVMVYDKSDEDLDTTLHIAAMNGGEMLDIVLTAVIESGHSEQLVNAPNNNGATALAYALQFGNYISVQKLLNAGAKTTIIFKNEEISIYDFPMIQDVAVDDYSKCRQIIKDHLQTTKSLTEKKSGEKKNNPPSAPSASLSCSSTSALSGPQSAGTIVDMMSS